MLSHQISQKCKTFHDLLKVDKNRQIELEKILGQKINSIKKLVGGSRDHIYSLVTDEGRYIFKSGDTDSISSQIEFYEQYSDLPYLPQLIYSNSDRSELIITQITGEKSREHYDKEAILTVLIDRFIFRYKIVNSELFGFTSKFLAGKTFSDFLVIQAKDAYSYIQDLFPPVVLEGIQKTIRECYKEKVFKQQYLLHGDLGFHNFFYSKNKLLGIIDPDPIIGHPVYDLMFAFCSTPEQINPESLERSFDRLNNYFPINKSRMYDYFTIALFKRIASCKKHHPNDLEKYMSIWKQMGVPNK